ncbi:MAG: hypothetical protein AUH43_03095 [Acidobacteria bacterium 13_1_40CM_65_14]|nr:MAG: hypothetical protein AUH43_03095 [Acidobacteria bacterium 13_1_40CM_65_14]
MGFNFARDVERGKEDEKNHWQSTKRSLSHSYLLEIAKSSSSSSGMLLHRKNDKREAISTSERR